MSPSIRSFDRMNIPAPCDADWDSMVGNERVRFCEHCKLHVENLSALTRQQAMRLVARSEGRLCVRFVSRPDGQVLTKEIPEKFHHISRRVARMAAGAFTATLSISAAGHAQGISPTSRTSEIATHRAVRNQQEPIFATARLFGTIIDPAGAVIPAVNIKLTNTTTGEEKSATSSDEGAYAFDYVLPGIYTLEASATGFKKLQVREIDVRADANRSQDLTLEVDGTFVTVGVVAVSVPEDPLIQAAFNDDLVALVERIPATADINASDKATDTSALAYAISNNNRDMVHVLISAGASPNSVNSEGATPLMYLSSDATVEFVRDLIRLGADVKAHDNSGRSVLMTLARSCNFAVLKEVIDAGAKFDERDNDGNTVLMSAAENADVNVLKFLIKSGLALDRKNKEDESALLFAAQAGRSENLKVLIDAGAAINFGKQQLNEALLLSARNGDSSTLRILLKLGASANAKDDDTTVLMLAAEDGNPEMIKALIDEGAKIDAVDDSGWTAIMHANEAENVRVLLNAGANIAIKNNDGETALAMAIRYEQEEIVQLLKSRGAPQ